MSDYKNKHYRHSGKGRNLREEAKTNKNLNLWDLVDDAEQELEDKEDEENF